ncbi:MAG: SHOCT domain-containing protein, partial [Nitrospiraceae bacterium]
HWGWMLFGGLMMLLFWGGIIALAVVVVRALSGGSSTQGQSGETARKTALQLLEERYARGEIDKKEFDSIKRDISS